MLKRPDLLVGAHVSIAGGIWKAPARGDALGCSAIQIFTRNATRWNADPLTEEEIALFKKERERTGITVLAHDSYLINLGSPKPKLIGKSVNAFLEEMERCETLEIPFLVMHPGSHTGSGEDRGLKSVSRALNHLLEETAGFCVKILLENTAGQGSSLGWSFEHLDRILQEITAPERMGVCLDTCHAYAAGYDLSDRAGYVRVMQEFDRVVGMDTIEALHLNDCKKGLGSRTDRHEHLGRGTLGLECFRLIMNDARFDRVPKIIETPNELDGVEMDPVNLKLLRELAADGDPEAHREKG